MYCEACGREIADGTKICPYCLAKQSVYEDAESNQPQSPVQETPASVNTGAQENPKQQNTQFSGFQSGEEAASDTTYHPQDGNSGNGATPTGNPYMDYRDGANNGWQMKQPDVKPLGTWAFFGYSLLFGLPFVGFILQIVFACVDVNVNLKHFARSKLLLTALWFIICLIFTVLMIYFFSQVYHGEWFDSYEYYLDEYMHAY